MYCSSSVDHFTLVAFCTVQYFVFVFSIVLFFGVCWRIARLLEFLVMLCLVVLLGLLQKTTDDGLLRPKHLVVLCLNILTDNTDTKSISYLLN
jgi:hypothetical protein